MIDFNLKYEKVHSDIQHNSRLVTTIYATARKYGIKGKQSKSKYIHIGKSGQIYLGLDINKDHVNLSFGNILAKMRLLYELSKGHVDLSNVYAKLDNSLGILSEDVSYGAELFADNTPDHQLDLDLLREAFKDIEQDLERTTFWSQIGEDVRKVIIDLDHVIVQPKYCEKIDDWAFDYEHDSRFQIREFC